MHIKSLLISCLLVASCVAQADESTNTYLFTYDKSKPPIESPLKIKVEMQPMGRNADYITCSNTEQTGPWDAQVKCTTNDKYTPGVPLYTYNAFLATADQGYCQFSDFPFIVPGPYTIKLKYYVTQQGNESQVHCENNYTVL